MKAPSRTLSSRATTLTLALSASLMLAACGGSSGDDDPTLPTDQTPGSGSLINPSETLDLNDNVASVDCGSIDPDDPNPPTDPDSSTALWSDNCRISTSSFANSAYTVGIQRILFCTGFSDGATEAEFVDGAFGAMTAAAVGRFQVDRNVTDSITTAGTGDGIVGPQTWAELNTALTEIGTSDNGFAQFAVEGTLCPDVQFYQEIVDTGAGPQRAGWSMALRPGSLQRTTFSTAQPNQGSL